MRWALAVLAILVVAGCSQPAQEAEAFATRVVFDERGTYYVGDLVEFEAQATEPVTWVWDFGDGGTAAGAVTRHAFHWAGTFTVAATATAQDGRTARAEATIRILAVFGAPGAPPGPPEAPPADPGPLPGAGDDTGIVRLELVGEEPTTGEGFQLRLAGPAELGSGTVSLWIDGTMREFAVSALPAAIAVESLPAGRKDVRWLADLDGQAFSGALLFDVWGEPIEFGPPTAAQWLRPGVHSEVCTVNFLFHYKWYRFFVGSAAHCVDDLDINQVCQAEPTGRIGKRETLHAHDSSKTTSDVWVAYESWLTMDRVGGGGAGVCEGNDFALLELGPKAQQVMHPAALYFGGPTAMAPVGGYGLGSVLYGYGASNLHGNVGVGYPGQETVNAKRGVSLGTANGGYSQHVYFAIPGVPGDSGGPAFGPNGEALGAASTIFYTPFTGSNHYTVIPKALAYMAEHEGWAPELVTYDEWSVTG